MAHMASSICLTLAIFCASFGTALCNCTSLDQYFFIRNKVSGYVLDTSDYKGVKIQPFNASSRYQQFRLHPASRTGLFNIYMDDDLWDDFLSFIPVGDLFNDANLTMASAEGSVYQEWFLNADGTIINAGLLNHGITVQQSPWYAGNYLAVVDASNFGPDQTFELTNERFP